VREVHEDDAEPVAVRASALRVVPRVDVEVREVDRALGERLVGSTSASSSTAATRAPGPRTRGTCPSGR
jgi:hypothetical protein